MKFLILAGLLGMATAPPIPRFTFYPPQVPPLFPQIPLPPSPPLPLIPIPLPFPYDPSQALTPNDFIALITSILNQLGGLLGK